MTTRRRIVTIHFRPQRGGLVKRLYAMIGAAVEAGFAVEALSADPLDPPSHERVEGRRVFVSTARRSGLGFWLSFSLSAPIALLRAASRRDTAAIVVFEPFYAALAAPARWLTGVPVVLFVRALPWKARTLPGLPATARTLAAVADRFAFRVADRVVVMTDAMRRDLAERVPIDDARVGIVPNAVVRAAPRDLGQARRALRERYGWRATDVVVATSGVLTARKNVTALLAAMTHVEEASMRLLVVGDGPEREALERASTERGLEARVGFTGWIDDPTDTVGSADLFVLPSVHEGMSNSLLEALGLGLPVLAADTPEHRELLDDADLVFDVTAPETLAGKLDRFATEAAYATDLGERAAAVAERLSFDWGARVLEEIRAATDRV